MDQWNKRESQQGFTLVELLIAIFIFAIVVSSVYGAYRATFRIIHGSESHLAISRNARIAMERITEDLKSIVAGPGGEFRGERIDLAGTRGDNLAFLSSSHLILSKKDTLAGYAVIMYSAERNGESGLLDLYRSDRVLLPGAEKEKKDSHKDILAAGLQEVNFSYLDADGKAKDEWQSDDGKKDLGTGAKPMEPLLPALVYVKLVFAKAADDKNGTVFRTAMALPQKAKEKK
jgi:general secretion pathway protein J